MINNEVVIIGGGLAGLVAAIHLSKIGIPVILIEKNSFPKHKVCGEYISNEVIPYFDWLGIHIEELKPSAINHLDFSTKTGKNISCNLPLGGFGISRYALDNFLYQKAISQKCTILQESVIDVVFENDLFSITLSNQKIINSKIVIGAYGKRSNIDQVLNRSFIKNKSFWLAAKGHYEGEFPSNLVGLHNFEGGYCGISKVENSIINICYLANYKNFKPYKDLKSFQEEVLCKNPHLKAIFENAAPVFEKPLTISQISFDKKKPVENHILMIGDTAGLIHPLCGNGMAMAIHSAKIASEVIEDYREAKIKSRTELEKKYEQNWNKNFKSRLQVGRLLSSVLRNQKLSELLLRIFIHFPSLLPKIIKKTHGVLILK